MASFFKKILASIGIGAAEVDTILEKEEFMAGEVLKGYVLLKGGNTDQQIDKIKIFLLTQIPFGTPDEGGQTVYTVLEQDVLPNPLLLKAKTTQQIPFEFEIPTDTPLSLNANTQTWLKTSADIDSALDPTDADHIRILPDVFNKSILGALQKLGFSLDSLEYEPRHYRMNTRFPFVQKLVFRPTTTFKQDLEELEVIFISQYDCTELFLEIDRRRLGLDLGEKSLRLEVNIHNESAILPILKTEIQAAISR